MGSPVNSVRLCTIDGQKDKARKNRSSDRFLFGELLILLSGLIGP